MTEERFVVCVNNDDYPVDLMRHKIYRVLPDAPGDPIPGWIRIVDESGEDYLYPGTYFHPMDVPAELREALLRIG